MALRARQVQAIGATYTIIPSATIPATSAYGPYPSRRGNYRCDTFVLDVYRASTYWAAFNTQWTTEQRKWNTRIGNLAADSILPRILFNQVKSFQ